MLVNSNHFITQTREMQNSRDANSVTEHTFVGVASNHHDYGAKESIITTSSSPLSMNGLLLIVS